MTLTFIVTFGFIVTTTLDPAAFNGPTTTGDEGADTGNGSWMMEGIGELKAALSTCSAGSAPETSTVMSMSPLRLVLPSAAVGVTDRGSRTVKLVSRCIGRRPPLTKIDEGCEHAERDESPWTGGEPAPDSADSHRTSG